MDPDALPELSYGTIDREYAARLATVPAGDDGPVWMVNLMRYRERAAYADGRATELTGRQADDRYAPFGPFRTVGAELVFLADVEAQPVGDDQEWDRIAIVRYPDRRSFLRMQELPEYVTLHEHKDAGMASTYVLCCTPAGWPELPAGAPALDQVPHPTTPGDGPVVLLHVLRHQGDRTPGALDVYAGDAGRFALPHGVRITAWFDVEGTIVGDGRQWDEVRVHRFPSWAAVEAVATDPGRIAAGASATGPDPADAYTVVLRPVLDRLGGSFDRREAAG
jgi:hypothetical protein